MKKRVLKKSLLVIVVLVIVFLSCGFTAHAAGKVDGVEDLRIGNIKLISSGMLADVKLPNGVTYDSNSNIITLKNSTINVSDDYMRGSHYGIYYSGTKDLNIKVYGKNVIDGKKGGVASGRAIMVNNQLNVKDGDIYLNGTGVLDVKNTFGFFREIWNYTVDRGGDFYIDGLTITSEGHGITAQCNNVTIKNTKLLIDNKTVNEDSNPMGIVIGYTTEGRLYEGKLVVQNSKIEIKKCNMTIACNSYDFNGEYYYYGDSKAENLGNINKMFEKASDDGLYNQDYYLLLNPSKLVIKVSKISLNAISNRIAAGRKVTIQSEVFPAGANNKALSWNTNNKKYATVSSKGEVTTKLAGIGKTVVITAKAKDGSSKKANYKITIVPGSVAKISLKANKTLKVGKTMQIKATVKASTGANKILSYKSSNKSYATVSSKGVVKAYNAGKGKIVTITANATDGSGKKASVKIKIN